MKTNPEKAGAGVIGLSFRLNGKPVQLTVPPVIRAVDLIRNELGQTGTKISCGIGRCGACSVLINGKLSVSCLTLAYQLEGASVETVEGLSDQNGVHPIQEAFLEEGGFQCGYCTPGMVMAAKCLLESNPKPSEAAIQEAFSGNLCRCTGYGGIIRSVQRACSS
ncbi:(2Fe-2S)-binding protein [Domibacillus sp. PGB-M46]|uniref:(2Fe-2S)-binding protein n=1 Tax=Domibacillus sp. PGB-M46 TaxID=2910255 RepID=UPI001F5AAA8B|nr:(2Fe-2S)-binding protein [Domibacillus sp. PGB-M46]MCI2255719.1 (2Fe-2S)-binding protein [Domibacillus sp. PGB-M46]